jgi:translocation and assembly module TamB
LELDGTLKDPTLQLHVAGRQLSVPSVEPVDLDTDLTYRDERAHLEVQASDDVGELVTLWAEGEADLPAQIERPDPGVLARAPFSVWLLVPDRDVGDLPVPAPDLPLRVGLAAELGGGNVPLHGDIHVDVRHVPESGRLAEGCDGGWPPHLRASLAVRDGESRLSVRGDLHSETVLDGTVRASTPLSAWLERGFPERPPRTEATVELSDLYLSQVPGACEVATGRAGGRLTVADLFGEEPTVDLEVDVRRLTVADTDLGHLAVQADVDSSSADFETTVVNDDREPLRIAARAPIRWGGSTLVPELREEAWKARLRFDETPVALLAGPVPLIARPGGSLSGHIDADGRGLDQEALEVDGELVFNEVDFTVREPVTRFENMTGRLGFSNDDIRLEDIRVEDRDGSLILNGRIALEDLAPRKIEAHVNLDDYPVRSQGIIFATVDAEIGAQGTLGEDRRTLGVELDRAAVKLPEQSARSVQPLDPNPEVIYEGQPGFDRDLSVEEALAQAHGAPEESGASVPLIVEVDATHPFWVRRSDFAVQVSADLKVDMSRGETRISGPLQIRRGFLDLLGKTFNLEPGEIVFRGGTTLDPAINLTATHDLSDGTTIIVRIGGRLSNIELDFDSDDPALRTDEEVMTALTVGRRGSSGNEAESDATSMLAGLTAGLMGSLARRELGEWVPILSFESKGTLASTRLKAGFQADQIIPESWERFAQGAYIEGSVGGSEAAGAGPRVGVLLELYHPLDLITRAVFQQPDNWSLDLLWHP